MLRPACLVLALSLLAGCGAGEDAPARTLVLVTLDTTRADRLGAYGRDDAGTPVFDGLAARGTLFERAYAPTPITLPSHTTLLTGVLPPAHGVRNNALYSLAPRGELVSEALAQAGWRTAAFVSSYVLASRYGLDQGFEVYRAPAEGRGELERPAAAVVDDALEWLDGVAPHEPAFLWVHLYDAHSPYEPPAPFDDRADPYQGEIAYADRELGRLLDGLADRRPGGEPCVVVTADHGESLGEHDEETHGVFVYDATMRVPLVVTGGGAEAGRRVAGPVSLTAVAPTLLEAAGLPPGALPEARAASLLDAAPVGDEAVVLESLLPLQQHRWQPLSGVVVGEAKYIHTSRPEWYDLATDPGERHDLADDDPARLRALAARWSAALGALTPLDWVRAQAVSPADTERLAALGYVGFQDDLASTDASTLPLPRERAAQLPVKRHATLRFVEAMSLRAAAAEGPAGDADRARATALLEEVRVTYVGLLEEDDDDPASLWGLALVARALGRDQVALEALERHTLLVPRDPRAHFERGQLLHELGREEAARAAMAAATATDPPLPGAFRWLGEREAEAGRHGHAAGWLLALEAIWWEAGPARAELRMRIQQFLRRAQDAGQRVVAPPGHRLPRRGPP